MVAPGPSADELKTILSAAMRVPDHGKLAPWRFVIVGDDQRERLKTVLTDAYLADKPDAGRLEREAVDQFAHQAPTLIVVMSAPVAASKIPRWEQELSAGAAIMNLLTAAHALGYVGGWLTGWASYNDTVRDAFGGPHESIAGFVFIGTSARPLKERPRPDYDHVVGHWR